MSNERITIHSAEDFIGMRKAGKLAAQTLQFIEPYVQSGVSTDHLNMLCHDFILQNGAIPAPLNYNGFPKSICTSVNHVICHGIPSKKTLQTGDILNIDVTVILDGWYGDTSRMFNVGKIGLKAQKLIDVTYQCLMESIDMVKPGVCLGDIGHHIQTIAHSHRYGVVKDFCGHGIGRVFHAAPEVLHFGTPGTGPILQEGMFFTIEPMINAGDYRARVLDDGWTAVTRDKSLSAQFEHTIGVTNTGYEIFTLC